MIDLIFGLVEVLLGILLFGRGRLEDASPQYGQNELIDDLKEPINELHAVIIGALSGWLFAVIFTVMVSSAMEISDFRFLSYWLIVGTIAGPIGGLQGGMAGKGSKVAMAMGGIFLMPVGCIMFVSDINFLIFVGAIFGKLWLVVMLNLGLVALFFYAHDKGKLPLGVTMSLLAIVVFLQAGFFFKAWWISRCLPDCPNRNLSGIELAGRNLRGANLTGTDLSKANLDETDLRGANLSEANLRGANLDETNLSDADLNGADLSGAYLFGTDLHGANLSRANFNEADLNRVILNEARIDSTTQIDDKWRLVWEIVNHGEEDRDLSGVDLSGASLGGVDMHEVHLRGANLSGADLTETDLNGANLSGANLNKAYLFRANLRGADLSVIRSSFQSS